jgi:hypothetical protein
VSDSITRQAQQETTSIAAGLARAEVEQRAQRAFESANDIRARLRGMPDTAKRAHAVSRAHAWADILPHMDRTGEPDFCGCPHDATPPAIARAAWAAWVLAGLASGIPERTHVGTGDTRPVRDRASHLLPPAPGNAGNPPGRQPGTSLARRANRAATARRARRQRLTKEKGGSRERLAAFTSSYGVPGHRRHGAFLHGTGKPAPTRTFNVFTPSVLTAGQPYPHRPGQRQRQGKRKTAPISGGRGTAPARRRAPTMGASRPLSREGALTGTVRQQREQQPPPQQRPGRQPRGARSAPPRADGRPAPRPPPRPHAGRRMARKDPAAAPR